MIRKFHRALMMATMTSLIPVVMITSPMAAQEATVAPEEAQVTAAAAPAPATSVDQAGAPQAGWVDLGPKEGHWYKFKYDFNDTDDPTQAIVRLLMDRPEAVYFEVWTKSRLQAPLPTYKDDEGTVRVPVGVGNRVTIGEEKVKRDGIWVKEDIYNTDLLTWVGSSGASETFYVLVKNKTDQSASYSLSISGPDVSF